MPADSKVDATVTAQVVDYLKATPQAIALLFFAFLEGHLWTFLLAAYVRKSTKGDKILHTVIGRTAIGLLWMTPSFLTVYAYQFRSWPTDYTNAVSIVMPTVVLSLLLQLLAFVAFMKLGDR